MTTPKPVTDPTDEEAREAIRALAEARRQLTIYAEEVERLSRLNADEMEGRNELRRQLAEVTGERDHARGRAIEWTRAAEERADRARRALEEIARPAPVCVVEGCTEPATDAVCATCLGGPVTSGGTVGVKPPAAGEPGEKGTT